MIPSLLTSKIYYENRSVKKNLFVFPHRDQFLLFVFVLKVIHRERGGHSPLSLYLYLNLHLQSN